MMERKAKRELRSEKKEKEEKTQPAEENGYFYV